MTTVSQKLRALDYKVFREHRFETPEGRAQYLAGWWKLYAFAFVLSAIPFCLWALDPRILAWGLAPACVGPAFMAGMMRAEHLRAQGKNAMPLRKRPPGV